MRAIGIILAVLVWTIAVRLPFAGNVGEDEAFFILVGRNWLHGLVPYAHGYDVKPPGLFALSALAQVFLGPTIASMKALEIVVVAAAAAALAGLANRHISRPVAIWAAFVYPVASLFSSGVNAPAILIQAPFVILAFWAALEARQSGRAGWLVIAGLLIGAAGMVKQTAIFEAVALVGLVSWGRGWRAFVRAAVIAGLGAAVVPILFGLYFAAVGAFGIAFHGAVLGAAGRTLGDPMTAPGQGEVVRIGTFDALQRLLPLMKPLLGIFVLSVLAWLRNRKIATVLAGPWYALTLAWFVAGIVGVVAVKAMYDHYVHTLIAPMVLASGVFVVYGIEATGRQLAVSRVGATVFCALMSFLLDWRTLNGGSDMEAARGAAEIARKAGLKPGDGMLAPLRGLAVYSLSGAFAEGRYVHPIHLMCEFPLPDAHPLAMALAEHPRFIVMGSLDKAMVCELPASRAELVTALERDYRPIGSVEGSWDVFRVYERK